ncbi:MAG: septum site-determining protein MinC [Gloeomargarita sp. GMQP_bins_120]
MTLPLVQPGTDGLDLLLPPEPDWPYLQELLQHYFQLTDPWWPPHSPVRVLAGERMVTTDQWQWLATLLRQRQLVLTTVRSLVRSTAVAAAMAGFSVEQPSLETTPAVAAAPPLYVVQPVRSGVEIRHPGTVVVVGDVNPGGYIVADGDILVWGRLRGVAHAGAQGDTRRLIMALEMAATQIRIGDRVARLPPQSAVYPEVAVVQGDEILLQPARDFGRTALGGVF